MRQTFLVGLPKSKEEVDQQSAIDAAWALAQATFWPMENFKEKEVLHFKHLVSEHFLADISTEKNLIRFCVRVLLTALHEDAKRFYWQLRPHLWLNKNYTVGYSKSKVWYDELIEQRKLVAGYGQKQITLAYGMYKYSQNPCEAMYQHYREKLLHLKSYKYLQIFNNAVLYMNNLN